MASWARRSFAAATIFMAFVICRVDFTEPMRLRMSRREGTGFLVLDLGRLRLGLEDAAELAESGVERLPDPVVERLLLRDRAPDLRVTPVQELDELLHVARHLVGRDVADPALAALVLLRRRVDLDDLLLDRHRLVLALLQHLDEPLAAGERVLGGLVEVGAELREGGEL